MENSVKVIPFDPKHVPSEENFVKLEDGKTFFELR
jgi:hypothetical protein